MRDATRSAITITFGDVAENHVGMEKLGTLAPSGFTVDHLTTAAAAFDALGCATEVIDLVAAAGLEPRGRYGVVEAAYVLVVRGAVDAILDWRGHSAAAMFDELAALNVDTRALMYGRVVNKTARYNLCFGDHDAEPEYASGRGRVVAWRDVPLTQAVRGSLPDFLGPAADALMGEGNYYYDVSKCGIGFHGDAERRKVVGVRLGASIPLEYQWFVDSEPIGDRVSLSLHGGDLYVMSEKATGFDWRSSSKVTVRHAAGCDKYLTVKSRSR